MVVPENLTTHFMSKYHILQQLECIILVMDTPFKFLLHMLLPLCTWKTGKVLDFGHQALGLMLPAFY
jgi:hypothetical protein